MAAPILSFEGLGLVQGSGWLFRELDIHVGARDRLALIGRNGQALVIGAPNRAARDRIATRLLPVVRAALV